MATPQSSRSLTARTLGPPPASRKWRCWGRCMMAGMAAPIRRDRLGRVDQAHMRGDDAPAFGKADPTLHLPADLRGSAVAMKQGRGGRKIASERGDHGPRQPTGQPGGGAGRAKAADLIVTVQILGDAIADRLRTAPEQKLQF